MCKGNCKHCRHCGVEFAEDNHNIYYELICNKFDVYGISYSDLYNNVKEETTEK